jgi:hypothetical protein
MVGAINAPSSGNTYDAFKAKAVALSALPSQAAHTVAITGGVNIVASAGPATASNAAATATAPANSAPPSASNGTSPGSSGAPGSSSGAPTPSKSGAADVNGGGLSGIYAAIAAVVLGVAL